VTRRTLKSVPVAARAAALVLAGALLASPALSPLGAQVGYPPAESPYEDLRGRHGLTIAPGWFVTGGDPAGVGPRNGLMVSGRYELLLTGPLWLVTRMAYAPGLERTVKDPEVAPAARIVGTDDENLLLLDAGLALNLTGNKSWNRLAPRLHGNVGFVSSLGSGFDLGGYRFGNKFVFSWGMGTRYVTGSAWELNADVTHMLWKMSYPDTYGGDGSATDDSILGGGNLNPWQGNLLLSIGVTRYLRR
jgi:hypothetical protein